MGILDGILGGHKKNENTEGTPTEANPTAPAGDQPADVQAPASDGEGDTPAPDAATPDAPATSDEGEGEESKM